LGFRQVDWFSFSQKAAIATEDGALIRAAQSFNFDGSVGVEGVKVL
jgi:hypothetical protein